MVKATVLNRRCLVLGLLFSLILISLFIDARYLPIGLIWHFLMNKGHFLLFILLAVLLLFAMNIREQQMHKWSRKRYAWAFIVGIIMSVASELIQPLVNRSAQFDDFVFDILGICVGLGFCFLLNGREPGQQSDVKRNTRWGLILFISLMFLPVIVSLTRIIQTVHYEQVNFPLLASFENQFELTRWKNTDGATIKVGPGNASHGQRSLKLRLEAGTSWPGVDFKYPPENWESYDYLCFDIINPHKRTVTLNIRFDDVGPGRNIRIQRYLGRDIHYGQNQIRLPLQELVAHARHMPINLQHIFRIVLFIGKPKQTTVLYLDNVRLEKTEVL